MSETVTDRMAVGDHPTETPRSQQGSHRVRIDLIAHGASLVAVLAAVVVAARGQWFYYDEWDFLAQRADWALLASHNGHLSFFPQLLTTLTKFLFGLHSYWPYLAQTIIVHLIVVHLVWRLALRSGASWVFAVLLSTVFGVLAPAAENTLWAFQVGFITPLATGIGALLLVARDRLRSRDILLIAVLLVVGAGFSGTAIPMVGAVLVYLVLRHGWRSAIVPTASFSVIYGAWYLTFNRGQSNDFGVRPGSIHDLVVVVPEFVARAFLDSVGKMLPTADLAPVLLVALFAAGVIGLRRRSARDIPPAYFAALAALAFAVLTAYTRAGLGVESASAGRYVYVYGALLAPAAAAALTALAGRRWPAVGVLAALLALLALYNAAGLVAEGRKQAQLERNVERAMSAALAEDDGSAAIGLETPASLLAPTLTMEDIRAFEESGQFTPVAYSQSDALDVEVNLFLTTSPLERPAPDTAQCEPAVGGTVEVDPLTEVIWAPVEGSVRVHATADGAATQYATVQLEQGWNRLNDLDLVELRLNQPDAGGLCVVPAG